VVGRRDPVVGGREDRRDLAAGRDHERRALGERVVDRLAAGVLGVGPRGRDLSGRTTSRSRRRDRTRPGTCPRSTSGRTRSRGVARCCRARCDHHPPAGRECAHLGGERVRLRDCSRRCQRTDRSRPRPGRCAARPRARSRPRFRPARRGPRTAARVTDLQCGERRESGRERERERRKERSHGVPPVFAAERGSCASPSRSRW
jgi:hypothetical protein